MKQTAQLLNLKEAADHLRVSTKMVQRLAQNGRLRSVRIGKRLLFREDDLQAFVDSLAQPKKSDLQLRRNGT